MINIRLIFYSMKLHHAMQSLKLQFSLNNKIRRQQSNLEMQINNQIKHDKIYHNHQQSEIEIHIGITRFSFRGC